MVSSTPTEMSPYKFAKEVERVLDETVRPQLHKDGGDLEVVEEALGALVVKSESGHTATAEAHVGVGCDMSKR